MVWCEHGQVGIGVIVARPWCGGVVITLAVAAKDVVHGNHDVGHGDFAIVVYVGL